MKPRKELSDGTSIENHLIECAVLLKASSIASYEPLVHLFTHKPTREHLAHSSVDQKRYQEMYDKTVRKTATLLARHARYLFNAIPADQFLNIKIQKIDELPSAVNSIVHKHEATALKNYFESIDAYVKNAILNESTDIGRALVYEFWCDVMQRSLYSLDVFTGDAINAALNNIEVVCSVKLKSDAEPALGALSKKSRSKLPSYFVTQNKQNYKIISKRADAIMEEFSGLSYGLAMYGLKRDLALSSAIPNLAPYLGVLESFSKRSEAGLLEMNPAAVKIQRNLVRLQIENKAKENTNLFPLPKIDNPISEFKPGLPRSIANFEELVHVHRLKRHIYRRYHHDNMLVHPKKLYAKSLIYLYEQAKINDYDDQETKRDKENLRDFLYKLSFKMTVKSKLRFIDKFLGISKKGKEKITIAKKYVEEISDLRESIVRLQKHLQENLGSGFFNDYPKEALQELTKSLLMQQVCRLLETLRDTGAIDPTIADSIFTILDKTTYEQCVKLKAELSFLLEDHTNPEKDELRCEQAKKTIIDIYYYCRDTICLQKPVQALRLDLVSSKSESSESPSSHASRRNSIVDRRRSSGSSFSTSLFRSPQSSPKPSPKSVKLKLPGDSPKTPPIGKYTSSEGSLLASGSPKDAIKIDEETSSRQRTLSFSLRKGTIDLKKMSHAEMDLKQALAETRADAEEQKRLEKIQAAKHK